MLTKYKYIYQYPYRDGISVYYVVKFVSEGKIIRKFFPKETSLIEVINFRDSFGSTISSKPKKFNTVVRRDKKDPFPPGIGHTSYTFFCKKTGRFIDTEKFYICGGTDRGSGKVIKKCVYVTSKRNFSEALSQAVTVRRTLLKHQRRCEIES